jgi:predicted RNA-binding Zn ribbon-like protein
MPDMPKLIGGALCLDFVNTVDPRHASDRREYLDSYRALVAWGRHAGAIGADEAKQLLTAAAREHDTAGQVLHRAITLREALYRIFAGTARRHAPPPRALATLNGELAAALAHTRLTCTPAGFSLQWDDRPPSLDRVLWPVTRSAAELLVRGPAERVGECPGAGNCGWLFLDLSKNARRRWCDMRTCGNRAKARRHYAKSRPGAA